jgi:hypothetical protein
VALLVALCAAAATIPHAAGPDDPACSPVFVSHDASAHYVGALPARDTGSEHCYLCHSARSLFSFFDKHEQRDNEADAERLHAAPVLLAGRFAWAVVLGRAPPM